MPEPTVFDPRTGRPWWDRLTRDGEYPELILAQRKDFYVLLVHQPGLWAGFVGEGLYSSSPTEAEPRWEGELVDYVRRDAEKCIRERDPSFKGN
jgi:hypothetical protein